MLPYDMNFKVLLQYAIDSHILFSYSMATLNLYPFQFSSRMTKFDVRNYLEKIYSVPVAAVRTRIQYCE